MSITERFIKNQAYLYIKEGIVQKCRGKEFQHGDKVSGKNVRKLTENLDRVAIQQDSMLHLHNFNYLEIPIWENENGGKKQMYTINPIDLREIQQAMIDQQKQVINLMTTEELHDYLKSVIEGTNTLVEETTNIIEERYHELEFGMPKEQLENVAEFVLSKIEEELEDEDKIIIATNLSQMTNGDYDDNLTHEEAIYGLLTIIRQSHRKNQRDIEDMNEKLKKTSYALVAVSFFAGLIGAELFHLLVK